MERDPREVEMIAIINMQPVPEAISKEIQEIETSTTTLKIEEKPKEEEEKDDNDTILKPGAKIRPIVTVEEASKLAERLYGIVTSEIIELISYDDRNFLIKADRFVFFFYQFLTLSNFVYA